MSERIRGDSENENTVSFEGKKQSFFTKTGFRLREALEMHRDASAGNMWGKKNTTEDWRNVSEHCIVEATRAEVFAEKLGLSEDVKKDLITAAALHDFYKKHEIEKAAEEGLTFEDMINAAKEADKILKKNKFSDRVVRLAGSMAVVSLHETKKILEKDSLSEEDIAFLILHYIDDYTKGSDWVIPAEETENQGKINDLDRRIGVIASNPNYRLINEQGRQHFGGEGSYEAQLRIGHLVEEKLAILMSQTGNLSIEPKDLPFFIDQEIMCKIESES